MKSHLEGLPVHPQVTSRADLICSQHSKMTKDPSVVFPEMMSLLLRVIYRPRCAQFSWELFSIEEIVPMKTVHSETSSVTGMLFLERNAAVEFSSRFFVL